MLIAKSNIKLILMFALSFVLINCADTGNTVPTDSRSDDSSDLVTDDLIKQSVFGSHSVYSVSGDIELFFNSVTDTYTLTFIDFSSDGGPDVRVYLAQDLSAAPGTFEDLGSLKSTNGPLIRYDFPGSQYNPNFNQVLIWCKAFSRLFGSGLLVDL